MKIFVKKEAEKIFYENDDGIVFAISIDDNTNRNVEINMYNISALNNYEKIELFKTIYYFSAKEGLTPCFNNLEDINLLFDKNPQYIKDVQPIDFDGEIEINNDIALYMCIEYPLVNACKRLNEMGIKTLMLSANQNDVITRSEKIESLSNFSNSHFNLGNGYAWIMIDWESLTPENKKILILLNKGDMPLELSEEAVLNLKYNCDINNINPSLNELICFFEVFDYRVWQTNPELIGKLPTQTNEDIQYQGVRRSYACINSLCNHGIDYRTVVIRYPLDENTLVSEVDEFYMEVINKLCNQKKFDENTLK